MHINNIINNILINILNCFTLTSIVPCTTYNIIYNLLLFTYYLAAITSDISYIPALLPARNLAASIAPLANTDLEYAV